jgi:3-oxoacyl-[acyl-carrier protein] reductase
MRDERVGDNHGPASSSRPVALVTGAARGIGRATAVELARRGYDVALVDIRKDEVEQAAADAARLGGETLVLPVDLADLDAARDAIDRTAAKWPRLDLLVNNAAWRELTTMRQITPDSWDQTLRICLTAPAFLARWAAEVMERRGRGVILNVSSIMAASAAGTSPAYIAAKGGLEALTYELAALYGRAGIRVVGVAPGAVDTDMSRDQRDQDGASVTAELRAWTEDLIPAGRWASPEDIARAIAMIASDDAGYLAGTIVTVDGGLLRSFLPHSLKRRIDPGQFR